jgi:hypothetical protein
MANKDMPNGFLPYLSPADGRPKIHYYDLLTTNDAIGRGDPIVMHSDGFVNRAAASDVLVGIAAEPKAANSGGKLAIWDDPMQEFVAQTDNGTGTATAQTCMNLNVNFVAGAPSSGRSIAEIDESSATTTATLPLRIVRLSEELNNALGEFNRLVVRINAHKAKGGTGTVGV